MLVRGNVGFYLAVDGALDTGDQLLDSVEFPGGLRTGDPQPPTTRSLRIPAVANGPALIGVIVDSGGTVAETDESNNMAAVPVTITGTGIAPCDVNGDGQTNVSDVQETINVALGLAAPSGFEDVNGDGQTNVSDVQQVINGALGGSCP